MSGSPSPRSPQDKKALSYARDSRPGYGESDKGARKTVPRRKAKENRRDRRGMDAALHGLTSPDEARADLAESSARHGIGRVGGWRKSPDMRLGAFVVRQFLRRVGRIGRKRRRAQDAPE